MKNEKVYKGILLQFVFGFLLLITPYFLFPTITVHAAEVLVVGPREIGVGEVGTFDVIIDSASDVVNAVEGTFVLDGSAARLGEVFRGGSLLSFWLGTPEIVGNNISITGIMPGGYNGATGKLFSFELVGTTVGSMTMSFGDLRVLRHDGQGTDTTVNNSYMLDVVIRDEPVLGDASVPLGADGDTIAPESFDPIIVKNNNLYGGDTVVVFSATDKGQGISYFEVQEQLFGGIDEADWVRAESPYRLRSQWRLSTVYVKAVDSAGNIRIETVPPNLLLLMALLIVFVLLIFFLLIVVLLLIWRNRKLKREQVGFENVIISDGS